jgi:hypothetical protein
MEGVASPLIRAPRPRLEPSTLPVGDVETFDLDI